MAVFGIALTALSLTGSTQLPANDPNTSKDPAVAQMRAQNAAGARLFKEGKYLEAREVFLHTAALAKSAGWPRIAAPSLNNAGGAALAAQNFRQALSDFLQARDSARRMNQFPVLARTLNNLASLYLQMGNPAAAAEMAGEGLAVPASRGDPTIEPKLKCQLANATAELHRYEEARRIYRAGIDGLDEQGDFENTARALAAWGNDALAADRLQEAEDVYTEALRLARVHRLGAGNILRGLARVKARTGDARAASALFDAAIAAPPGITPRWVIYADRGDFQLSLNDLPGALADFREANRMVSLLRADIVPADQDRITLESGLSRVAAGLVEAGNRLARQTGDGTTLKETFNAAEQDRLWSLRALTPTPNDWRSRVPQRYWDLLARYQALELKLLSKPSEALESSSSALRLELDQIEATAGNSPAGTTPAQPLETVQRSLDSDSVLFSFHLSQTSGWVWAADRSQVDAWPVPSAARLKPEVEAFTKALKTSDPQAQELGRRLYSELFGSVPARYAGHKRWLLELDGPLYDLPFAALVVNERQGDRYLVQRAALQAIPGALMLQHVKTQGELRMLEIGDPVYNAADARYAGAHPQGLALPRLTGTDAELQACRRTWGADRTRVLSGSAADLAGVESALQTQPAVIHFATHVVSGPGEFASGLIALSLDPSGAMGLMGPAEIVARPVTASLVVLNGCHSARGEALPASGLMGLTRAWLGAGAGAVISTRWDIPDDASQALIAAFYRHLRDQWDRGPAFALQAAQLELLQAVPTQRRSDLLGAYFLLGRT